MNKLHEHAGWNMDRFLKLKGVSNDNVNPDGLYTTVDGVLVRKIYVSKLLPSITEKDLRLIFGRFGKVTAVSIVVKGYEAIKTINFAFVTFESPASASCALRNKHFIFFGRSRLYISPADSWHQPSLGLTRQLNSLKLDDDNAPTSSNVRDYEPVVLQDDDTCAISRLNDDCLLLIFEYLTLNERLTLLEVCLRWKTLSMSLWSSVRSLDFSVPPLCFEFLTDSLLTKYVKLCNNLTTLHLSSAVYKDLSSNAIIIVAQHCKKLEKITLQQVKMRSRSLAYLAKNCPKLNYFYMKGCPDNHEAEMVSLVKMCKNLEYVGVKHGNSAGKWLSYLRPPIKSLTLQYYGFMSTYLLAGLKNLTDCLTSLTFTSCVEYLDNKDIVALVDRAPNLSSLIISGSSRGCRSFLDPIIGFKQLTRLILDNTDFVHDKLLEELPKHCVDLQCLSLTAVRDDDLTTPGLNAISHFYELTHLILSRVQKLTDSNLKAISRNTKKLKEISLMLCQNVSDDGCSSLIANCKDLEIIDVCGCENVTTSLVYSAIETRKGTHKKLMIIAGDSHIDLNLCYPPFVNVEPFYPAAYHGALHTCAPHVEVPMRDCGLFGVRYRDFDDVSSLYDDTDFDDEDFDDDIIDIIDSDIDYVDFNEFDIVPCFLDSHEADIYF